MRRRRTTVEISRQAETRSAFGYPFRAYFGDLGFAGRKNEALRRAGRPAKKSASAGGQAK